MPGMFVHMQPSHPACPKFPPHSQHKELLACVARLCRLCQHRFTSSVSHTNAHRDPHACEVRTCTHTHTHTHVHAHTYTRMQAHTHTCKHTHTHTSRSMPVHCFLLRTPKPATGTSSWMHLPHHTHTAICRSRPWNKYKTSRGIYGRMTPLTALPTVLCHECTVLYWLYNDKCFILASSLPWRRSEYSDRNAGKTNLSFTRWNQRTQPFSCTVPYVHTYRYVR